MNASIRAAFLFPVLLLTSLAGAGTVSYVPISRLSSECALGGNTVAWTSWQAGTDVLLAYDLASQQTQVVASGSAWRQYIGISGRFMVWQDWHGTTMDVLGKNLATGENLVIAAGTGSPAISGSTVLWYDGARHGIYGRDLLGGSEFLVINDAPWGPLDFDGRTVVYQHYADSAVTEIRGYDLVDHRQFTINAVGAPSVSGRTVVWAGDDGNGGDIFAYDIPTGSITALTSDTASQTPVKIRGNLLAWTQTPRMDGDLNYDGTVDFADYGKMEVCFGIPTGMKWSNGDMDGDGDVDFADYQRLEVKFAVDNPDAHHAYARNLETGTVFDLGTSWTTPWTIHVSGNEVTATFWDRVYFLSEDGAAGLADYQTWGTNFGQTIPEPAVAALLTFGAVVCRRFVSPGRRALPTAR